MIKILSTKQEQRKISTLKRIHTNSPVANITFNREKCESFLLRLRGKQGCSLTSPHFNITLEVLANAISYEKKKKTHKGYTEWEERNKTVFVDDMIVYVENPKEIIKNNKAKQMLEQISDYSKGVDKRLMYKSQSVSYISVMNKWNFGLKTYYCLHQLSPK